MGRMRHSSPLPNWGEGGGEGYTIRMGLVHNRQLSTSVRRNLRGVAYLAIELDGDSHYTDEAQIYDKERTEYLNTCGIRVVRFTNKDVMRNIMGTTQAIASMLPSP